MNKLLLCLLMTLPLVGACQSDEDRLEAEAREALGEVVIDPTSFLVRKLRRGSDQHGAKAICGEVNAKNRMGAYVGFQPFVAAGRPPKVSIAEEPGEDRGYEMAYYRFCATPLEKRAYETRLAEERRQQEEESRRSQAILNQQHETISRLKRQYEQKRAAEAAQQKAADAKEEADCIARLRGLARSVETLREIEQTCRGE